MVPKLFGFPLWYGKIKRRQAKKYLNSYSYSTLWFARNKPQFAGMSIGDVVNTCDGFNHKIHDLIPQYIRRGNGYILVDIDMVINEFGGMCSLTNCGISTGKSREYIESSYAWFLDSWLFGGAGATWYGGLDNPRYQKEISRLTNRYDTIKSGAHICDERGFLLKEYA